MNKRCWKSMCFFEPNTWRRYKLCIETQQYWSLKILLRLFFIFFIFTIKYTNKLATTILKLSQKLNAYPFIRNYSSMAFTRSELYPWQQTEINNVKGKACPITPCSETITSGTQTPITRSYAIWLSFSRLHAEQNGWHSQVPLHWVWYPLFYWSYLIHPLHKWHDWTAWNQSADMKYRTLGECFTYSRLPSSWLTTTKNNRK